MDCGLSGLKKKKNCNAKFSHSNGIYWEIIHLLCTEDKIVVSYFQFHWFLKQILRKMGNWLKITTRRPHRYLLWILSFIFKTHRRIFKATSQNDNENLHHSSISYFIPQMASWRVVTLYIVIWRLWSLVFCSSHIISDTVKERLVVFALKMLPQR